MTTFRRPLLPCLMAYVLGLWLVHEAWHAWPVAAVVIAVVIVAICATHAWKHRSATALILLAIVATGAAVMGVRETRAAYAKAMVADLESPLPRIISGRVAATSETGDAGALRVILKKVLITSGTQTLALPGFMQINLDQSKLASPGMLMTGERIAFPGHVYKPRSLANFFGYNHSETLRHRRIYAAATPINIKDIVISDPYSAGFAGRLERRLIDFRKDVTQLLHSTMWPRESRLMVAMLFNDMRALHPDELHVFRDSGTLHLFAVSGMHVAILGFVLGMFFKSLRLGLRSTWVCVSIALFLYLWVIGFVPSATRAYFMLTAFTAGYLLRREVDGLTSLVFAAAVVIFYDPAAPWDVGFLLSVLGTGSILLFTPLMRMWFWGKNMPGPDSPTHSIVFVHVMDLIFVGISIAIVLFPVQVYFFGYWNVMSVVANLLQAALSSLLLSAGVLTAAFGLIWQPMGQLFGQTASALMWLTYEISHFTADAYWALFYFRQVPAWLVCLCYAIIFAGYYICFRDTPEFRFKSRARFTVHAVCGLGMILGFQLYEDLRSRGVEIWAMDVGQGDATLLRLPNGETMLIDAGRSSPNMGALVVTPQLRGLGINMLDYIVATHDDDDHTGGIAEVIRRVGARYLLVPAGFQAKSNSSIEMLNVAKTHGCIVREVSEGMTATAGRCTITILNPPAEPSADRVDNENSIVLKVDYGKFSALLMGDAGLQVESRLINTWLAEEVDKPNDQPGLSILKVGHHGSKTGSGQEFIDAVRPVCALVSCGARNNFGHPAVEVQARLKAAGTRLLRTDDHGAIRIITNGEQVSALCCRAF